jgi:DNA-binding NarL/FixJ family response regulator
MKTVLLIDDDKLFSSTVQKALSNKHYKVLQAYDGHEGLAVATQEKPDLILLDVLMPNMGGMKFLGLIKEDDELKHIPIIIATNFDSMNYVDEGMKLGARGYIMKSDESLKTITDIVESTIGQSDIG